MLKLIALAGGLAAATALEDLLLDASLGETEADVLSEEKPAPRQGELENHHDFAGEWPKGEYTKKPDWYITPDEFFFGARRLTVKGLKKYIKSMQHESKLMTQNWWAMERMRYNDKKGPNYKASRKFNKRATQMIRKDAKKLAYCQLMEKDLSREFLRSNRKAMKLVDRVDDCGRYLDSEHEEYYMKSETRKELTMHWLSLAIMAGTPGHSVPKPPKGEKKPEKKPERWPQEALDAWKLLPDGTELASVESHMKIPNLLQNGRRREFMFDFQHSMDLSISGEDLGDLTVSINAQIIGGCPAAWMIIRHENHDYAIGDLWSQTVDLCEFSLASISRDLGVIGFSLALVGRLGSRVTCNNGARGGCHKNLDATEQLPYATFQGIQFVVAAEIDFPWFMDDWAGELELACWANYEVFGVAADVLGNPMYKAGFCPTMPTPELAGGWRGQMEIDWTSSEFGNTRVWSDRVYTWSNLGQFIQANTADPFLYMHRSTVGRRHTTYSVDVTGGTQIYVLTDRAGFAMPGSGWGSCPSSFATTMRSGTSGNYPACYAEFDLGSRFGSNRYHCFKGCQMKSVTEDERVQLRGNGANKFVAFFREACSSGTSSNCGNNDYCGYVADDFYVGRSSCRQQRIMPTVTEPVMGTGNGALAANVPTRPWSDRSYSWTDRGAANGYDLTVVTTVSGRAGTYTVVVPANYRVLMMHDNTAASMSTSGSDAITECPALGRNLRHANRWRSDCHAEYTAIGNRYCYKGCWQLDTTSTQTITVVSTGDKTNVFLENLANSG